MQSHTRAMKIRYSQLCKTKEGEAKNAGTRQSVVKKEGGRKQKGESSVPTLWEKALKGEAKKTEGEGGKFEKERSD